MDGLPVAVEVFAGNTGDPATLGEQVVNGAVVAFGGSLELAAKV